MSVVKAFAALIFLSFLLGVSSQNITATLSTPSWVYAMAIWENNIYIYTGDVEARSLELECYSLDLTTSCGVIQFSKFVSEEVSLIVDEANSYLYLVSGWNLATIDLVSFTVVATGWGGSTFETSAGFTSDYKNLYISVKGENLWQFSQFTLPDFTFVQNLTLNNFYAACPDVPGNVTSAYGPAFWCFGSADITKGYCYGKLYPQLGSEIFRIYSIDLTTFTATNLLRGFMLYVTNNGGSDQLYFTDELRRDLLVEEADANFERQWAALITGQYETSITGDSNYIYVTGRIWTAQYIATLARITLDGELTATPAQWTDYSFGSGEEVNPMVAYNGSVYIAAGYKSGTGESSQQVVRIQYLD